MSEGPAPLVRLVTELARLPGIGRRTAQRLAFHLLRAEEEQALALADAIREVKEKVTLCEECFNLAEGSLCDICADPERDRSVICVVEEPADVIPIERTHEYRGLYHVLGGALSPIDGIDPEDLRIAELIRRVKGTRPDDAPDRTDEAPDRPDAAPGLPDGEPGRPDAGSAVEEVVLATNPTTTGEATALHIAEALSGLARVSRLASGLPVGADLEHADEVTLGKAFAGRRSV